MPDILYVSLSDMHLGEEDILLTHVEADGTQTEPTQPSPVMWQLVTCLRDLVSKNENAGKPTLKKTTRNVSFSIMVILLNHAITS